MTVLQCGGCQSQFSENLGFCPKCGLDGKEATRVEISVPLKRNWLGSLAVSTNSTSKRHAMKVLKVVLYTVGGFVALAFILGFAGALVTIARGPSAAGDLDTNRNGSHPASTTKAIEEPSRSPTEPPVASQGLETSRYEPDHKQWERRTYRDPLHNVEFSYTSGYLRVAARRDSIQEVQGTPLSVVDLECETGCRVSLTIQNASNNTEVKEWMERSADRQGRATYRFTSPAGDWAVVSGFTEETTPRLFYDKARLVRGYLYVLRTDHPIDVQGKENLAETVAKSFKASD
jgi:hypothetical protein